MVTASKPGANDVTVFQEMSEEEIKASNNSRTAAEALSHASGMLVTTNRRNEQLVQIYGLAQEKTLILIDGVPYYETKYHRLNLRSGAGRYNRQDRDHPGRTVGTLRRGGAD